MSVLSSMIRLYFERRTSSVSSFLNETAKTFLIIAPHLVRAMEMFFSEIFRTILLKCPIGQILEWQAINAESLSSADFTLLSTGFVFVVKLTIVRPVEKGLTFTICKLD